MNARKKRLIDASAIKYHTHRECGGHGIFYDVTTALKKDIDALPTVDAVEVVRCKDCKHRREEFCFHENWWKDDGFTAVCENDFCSYGERKE